MSATLALARLTAVDLLRQPSTWLAMLIGLVVTMKVYWVALLIAPKNVKH